MRHDNQCENFAYGYQLGLYFGGSCVAPSNVNVCYQDETGQLQALSLIGVFLEVLINLIF